MIDRETPTSVPAPCPFCEQPLHVSTGVNPIWTCTTQGCWLYERKIAIPLDTPKMLDEWNRRAASVKLPATLTTPSELLKGLARVICLAAGDDPDREGLGETPVPYTAMAEAALQEFTRLGIAPPTADGPSRRTIYVQWSDDGLHIRKWSWTPFAACEQLDVAAPDENVQ